MKISLGPDEAPPLHERLGELSFGRLEKYAKLANRSSGGSHALDRERWNRFVICCHQQNVGDPEDIREYFTGLDWAAKHIEVHVDRFDFGRDLLRSYDS